MRDLLCETFLAGGLRIDVTAGDTTLVCRIQAVRGPMLQLALPACASDSLLLRTGVPVMVTSYYTGHLLETTTVAQQWIWKKPPSLIVGPVGEWRKRCRRRAPRMARELQARLLLDEGRDFPGQTRDLSVVGVSLLLAGPADLAEGAGGSLTLHLGEALWCEFIPVRIVRVQQWLLPSGRMVEAGAAIEPVSDEQHRNWQLCLSRLGIER